jgi:hypothetical protein
MHVVDGVATSISTDGTTALLAFKGPDGEECQLTLPVGALTSLRAMCNTLITEARKRDIGAGMVSPRYPANFLIGNSADVRGAVMVVFDANTPDEAIFALPDEIGLRMADAIKADVLSRMTPVDKAKYLAGLAVPNKPSLFVPGR